MRKPLTFPQMNMYDTEKFFGGTSICNVGGCIFFGYDVDVSKLRDAINTLVANSDGIRIKIDTKEKVPVQYVEEYINQDFEMINLSEANYNDILKKWMSEPFDLSGRLYSFKLINVDNNIGVFVKLHHLICDAWGATLIASKLIEYYNKFLSGESISANDIPSYFKYVEKEEAYKNSSKFESDKEFWESKYEVKPTLVTMSPNKKTTLDVKAYRSSFVVPLDETEGIRKYCTDNQISPAVLLEAVIALYAARINNADDVTLCSLVINRNGIEEKKTIGMFNNILPLTIPIDYNETFLDLCQKIATEHYQVFRHQKYPLSSIVDYIREKHGKDVELYDIMVSYQNGKIENANKENKTEWVFNGTSDLGFMLNISDRDSDDLLNFDFDYRRDCFEKEEVERIYYRLINMVNQVVVNQDITCKNIDIITYFEKEQILIDFNNTKKEYPRNKCLHDFLEENVLKNPNKVALRFQGKELRYKEFNEKVNSLANCIAKNVEKRNSIIGVMMERSFEMMIAIYAIIKAGHAYMPMDPHFPKDRIEFMLEDSNAPFILTQTKWKNEFKEIDRFVDVETFDFDMYSKENPDVVTVSTDTAYVIYTSGSTGKPKGAMIPHHSAINRIKWMHEKYPLEKGDVILQKTPYTFDVSVWELFWWSMYDGCLQILIPEGHKDPAEIISGIEDGKVTHMHFVPSMLNAFLEYVEANRNVIPRLSTLKYVFASGEALQVEHVKKFYDLFGKNGTTLHNLYGPTECTVDVSYYDCDPNNIPSSIPIGKPVDNTQLLILDKNHKLLPIGVVGELYISGVLVGKGYLNREELTNEKFVPNIYYNYATMYKTGDLAMWLPDGNIEYLGRTDFQIKIRGLRVELGDIENAILKFENVKQCIVTVFENNGEKNLCAYYTASKKIDESLLKAAISKELPNYMVPEYYMRLEKIPTNANGKADRKAFPVPKIVQKEVKYVAPKNKLEEEIQLAVQDVLKIEKISCDEDLFTCGLTSIGVISIITKLSILGHELKVRNFYECHTISEIAELIQNEKVDIHEYDDDIKNYSDISDIRNHSLPCKNGDAILITGATSFLGIHIISELIKKTDKKIYCLIRKMDKFERFIKDFTNLDINSRRLIPLLGDITKNDLGLDSVSLNDVKKNVTDIIHCAAEVNFFCSWERSKEINHIGTCNVIELAKAAEAKLHHISTMSVSGDILTKQTKEYPEFTEKDLYIGQLYKENVYAHSKYLAEKEVIKAVRNDELNASIYRIANLTWRASDGKFQENYLTNDLYNLTKVMVKYKLIPLELYNENLSMAPADETATAIVSLMKLRENNIYNLYSNHSLVLSNYLMAITDCKTVTFKEFEKILRDAQSTDEIQFVLMYIANITNSADKMIVTFNCDETTKKLKKLGFEWSYQDEKYARFIGKLL